MSILKILQYPDLRLRRKAHQVDDVKSILIQKTINNMVETLQNTKNCAALASTQLDLEDPPSIIVLNYSKDENSSNIFCLINTQIISKEGSTFDKEGCMSVAPQQGIYTKIKRATKVKVTALDHNGNKLEFEANDYFARCIQHECDHLKGIIYLDYLSKSKRSRIDKKIARLAQSV